MIGPSPPPTDAPANEWIAYWVEVRLSASASIEGPLRRHAMREIKRLSKLVGREWPASI